MKGRALVSVVIPYLDDFEMLQVCVAALEEQTWKRYEVIVVDNGSGQDFKALGEFLTVIQVIQNPRNTGFSKAINQGCAAARGEFLLVLNSDAVLNPDYLEWCVEKLQYASEIGAVTGKLIKLTDPGMIDSTGHVAYADRRVKDRGEWEQSEGRFETEEDVFGIPATAALYRMSALADLKDSTGEIFDEDFFAYGEDVDLSWRLRLLGWRITYEPRAVALHRRDVSGYKRPTPTHVLIKDTRNLYLRMVKCDSLLSLWPHRREFLHTEARLLAHLALKRNPLVMLRIWGGFLWRLPRALAKRRKIQQTRRVSWQELEHWFEPPVRRSTKDLPSDR